MPATASLLQGGPGPFHTPCLLFGPGTRAFPAHELSQPAAEPAGMSLPSGMASRLPHVHPLGYISVHGLSAGHLGLREQGEALPSISTHPPGLLSAPACPGDPFSDRLPACRAR